MRLLCVCLTLLALPLAASDELTVYELLDPASRSFAITYDMATSAAGSPLLFNPIRIGSEVSRIRVLDRFTGKDLVWKLVTGKDAKATGHGPRNAADDAPYLQVHLAKPVPRGGEARVRIIKTYKDPASYGPHAAGLVFERSFGIRRNAIVLPAGFRLASCSAPVIVSTQADGRVRVSIFNDRAGQVNLRLIGARDAVAAETAHRAEDDKEITYWLLDPDSHRFRISHDFNVSRPGQASVHNFVRKGSLVSDASMLNLDTGTALKTTETSGKAVNGLGYYPGKQADDALVVQGDLEKPIAPGESVRIRVAETYTDAASYSVSNGVLSWKRSLGRPRNQVILPPGWTPIAVDPPAMLSTDAEGRAVLRFDNPRADSLEVSIRAHRAAPQ